jgi:7,8-dihydropterin-6-yl-methyl-4-(beta-D-ribofuranosyl)aminobenzene 5'-phosphate synthase
MMNNENTMTINLLCENQVGHKGARVCRGEWGFSALLESKDHKILFDTGHSDLYWKNAEALKLDLQSVDIVVFSHYHWDHTDGIVHHHFLNKKSLLIHPDLQEKLSERTKKTVLDDFNIIPSRKTYKITEDIIFLGEIPRKMSFEKGTYKDDPMKDDTALAIKTSRGVVVLTGCSHSGICNICEYAKEVTHSPLHSVIGGFHLMSDDRETVKQTISYFKKEAPQSLYPMHCVDFPVLAAFHKEFGVIKAATGDQICF